MENISIILCKVQTVRKNRFVDLVPLFKPNGVSLPVLRNVPVGLFGDSVDHYDWKIKVGNIVPCFITTFDISSYISQGNVEKMDTRRRNNLNSAFILPFTIPTSGDSLAFPDGLRAIGNRLEEGEINQTGNVKRSGDTSISGNTSVNGNSQITNDLTVSGNTTTNTAKVSSSLSASSASVGGIDFETHRHKDAEGRYTEGAE